ncbi:glycosyltransferase family 2 protein [Salinigranum halophilum]|uniref:glycosyltransferase family 2 protein n=1 Tax=Salinigranum halophilum TaxID=2565931 RepID=UPI0010A8ADF9|nr:glycosyltransferase family 2 protein [Salinigranum halophilum]
MDTYNTAATSTQSAGHTNGRAESVDTHCSGDELLLDADSERVPTLSVVMPTLNEEEGIGECIRRIKNALEELQVYGEIVVSDDSEDKTPEIAREMGAIVVTPDKKGYGYAYLYAFDRVRGDIIAMGDADTTYDFEELPKLYDLVENGEADMAMGSRLQGEILDGSMPALHQYIGNPLLTKFLNVFYKAGVSDAHSGMRVFTREAYQTMNPSSTGMEFASEMIMRAGAENLVIKELPITYHPREGEANLESLPDGWRHVKFMLVNAPGYLFSAPGITLALAGVLVMAVALSDVSINGATLGVNSMIAGGLFAIVGVQVSLFGAFATIAGEPIRSAGDPLTTVLVDKINLEHGATGGLLIFTAGAAYSAYVVWQWAASGYAVVPIAETNVLALTAVVLGVQIVFSSFLLSVLVETN